MARKIAAFFAAAAFALGAAAAVATFYHGPHPHAAVAGADMHYHG